MQKFEGIHFYVNVANFNEVVIDEESKNGNNIIAYIGVGIAAIAGVLFAKGKKDE